MGLGQHCLCISVCVQREVGASIFGCTYLVTSTVLGTALRMPQKCNIFISKQKHSFSQVLLSASIKLLSETQFYLRILNLYILARIDWDGSHFLLKRGSVNYQLLYIWTTWAHLPWKAGFRKKNRMIVRRTMAQKTWRGMMQGEGMLDKIGIVHWMSLPNTPILWTLSMTSCRILPQEIYFRGSQYYKCSLVVNGWRHTVFLISKMEFQKLFETLWNPWR